MTYESHIEVRVPAASFSGTELTMIARDYGFDFIIAGSRLRCVAAHSDLARLEVKTKELMGSLRQKGYRVRGRKMLQVLLQEEFEH